jgi:hypothetical protein
VSAPMKDQSHPVKQHDIQDTAEPVTGEPIPPPNPWRERCYRQRRELRAMNRAMAVHKANAEAWAREVAEYYGVDRVKRYRDLRFSRMEEVRRRERAESDVRKLEAEVTRLGGDPLRILKVQP